MNREMITNAASAVLNASAPVTVPASAAMSWWTWVDGHITLSGALGVSMLILTWLQIKEKLWPRNKSYGGRE